LRFANAIQSHLASPKKRRSVSYDTWDSFRWQSPQTPMSS
jgi:hypothetical protein